ncbi:MAG: hypothetical protein ACREX8_07680, partial [Gammaproteobacteria bacterium]
MSNNPRRGGGEEHQRASLTEVLDEARDRAERRDRARVPVDYDVLDRMVKRQRAALTLAVKSGDAEKVVMAAREAVREWNEPGSMWPDDWSRWQRAVDDA